MQDTSVVQLMNDFYSIVNTAQIEDAHTSLVRHAGLTDTVLALEALSLLLIQEHTRRRHAEARLLEAKVVLEESKKACVAN